MATVDLLTLLTIIVTYSQLNDANNVCYVEESGCKFRVTVLPMSSCPANHLNDQPQTRENSVATLGGDDASVPLNRLESLETRLVKMMEQLSVRSLRHIRQIRSDVRQMTQSVTAIKARSLRGGGGGVDGVGDPGTGVATRPRGHTRCPHEFVGVGRWRTCYRFSNFDASWHEAREYCSAFGANLVSLDSMKEAYIINYLIKSHPEFDGPKAWWTSGGYVARSRRWMWIEQSRMRPMSYSRWADGEPNARSTMHCMLLYKEAGYRWHDATCTDRHTFICEMN